MLSVSECLGVLGFWGFGVLGRLGSSDRLFLQLLPDAERAAHSGHDPGAAGALHTLVGYGRDVHSQGRL